MADGDPRTDRRDGARAPAAMRADHAAIDRLADELLPMLVARLGTTGLGELEVREGDWRVRLRRPAGERRVPASGRAVGRGGGRAHDEARGGAGTTPGAPASVATKDGGAATGGAGGGVDRDDPPLPAMTSVVMPAPTDVANGPLIATAPAVGVFHPGRDLRAGAKVRAGDRIGAVDMLGVAQEVVAPADGVVADVLAEDGDGVEYGQPLVALEPLLAPSHAAAPGPSDAPVAAGGEA